MKSILEVYKRGIAVLETLRQWDANLPYESQLIVRSALVELWAFLTVGKKVNWKASYYSGHLLSIKSSDHIRGKNACNYTHFLKVDSWEKFKAEIISLYKRNLINMDYKQYFDFEKMMNNIFSAFTALRGEDDKLQGQ